MRPHLSIPVVEASQVGEARRVAARLTEALGFDEPTRGRAALVVTELGTNLVRHARDGALLLGVDTSAGGERLEVLSLDQGPGMADLARHFSDGYSTGGSPGTGLGAVRRMSDQFLVHSVPDNGTVMVARIGATPVTPAAPPATPPRFNIAGIQLCAPGETVCGDDWGWRMHDHKASVMVADGLGHGPDAAEASQAATQVFERFDGLPHAVLERAHGLMRATRGAAVAIAELDDDTGSVLFAGAGNITGRLVSGVDDRTLLSQHGTLGLQIRKLSDARYDWPEHSMLVMHSDGITSRWSLDGARGVMQADPVLIAGWLIRGNLRGRDDATVVVVKRAGAAR